MFTEGINTGEVQSKGGIIWKTELTYGKECSVSKVTEDNEHVLSYEAMPPSYHCFQLHQPKR